MKKSLALMAMALLGLVQINLSQAADEGKVELAQQETSGADESSMEMEAGDTEESSSANSSAQSPVDTGSTLYSIRYVCTMKELSRRIEVDYLDPPSRIPCAVNYYKDTEAPGQRETPWKAEKQEGYCEDKANDFIEKLSNWGWSCQSQ